MPVFSRLTAGLAAAVVTLAPAAARAYQPAGRVFTDRAAYLAALAANATRTTVDLSGAPASSVGAVSFTSGLVTFSARGESVYRTTVGTGPAAMPGLTFDNRAERMTTGFRFAFSAPVIGLAFDLSGSGTSGVRFDVDNQTRQDEGDPFAAASAGGDGFLGFIPADGCDVANGPGDASCVFNGDPGTLIPASAFDAVQLFGGRTFEVSNVEVAQAASVVPEPSSVALTGLGAGALLLGARRRRRSA